MLPVKEITQASAFNAPLLRFVLLIGPLLVVFGANFKRVLTNGF